ncbi:hypothetical protein D3C72_2108830 [compost metagenome]
MPWQIAGNHGEPLVQRPLDHMPVQSGVVIKTMEDKQRRLRPFGPPELTHQLIPIDLEAPKTAAQPTLREIQPIELLIGLRLRRQRQSIRQWPQTRT